MTNLLKIQAVEKDCFNFNCHKQPTCLSFFSSLFRIPSFNEDFET